MQSPGKIKLHPAMHTACALPQNNIRKWKGLAQPRRGPNKTCRESSALRLRIEAQTFVDSDLFFLFRLRKMHDDEFLPFYADFDSAASADLHRSCGDLPALKYFLSFHAFTFYFVA